MTVYPSHWLDGVLSLPSHCHVLITDVATILHFIVGHDYTETEFPEVEVDLHDLKLLIINIF